MSDYNISTIDLWSYRGIRGCACRCVSKDENMSMDGWKYRMDVHITRRERRGEERRAIKYTYGVVLFIVEKL